jgi:hypothetical protein
MGNLTTSWYNPDILGFEWFDWNSLSLSTASEYGLFAVGCSISQLLHHRNSPLHPLPWVIWDILRLRWPTPTADDCWYHHGWWATLHLFFPTAISAGVPHVIVMLYTPKHLIPYPSPIHSHWCIHNVLILSGSNPLKPLAVNSQCLRFVAYLYLYPMCFPRKRFPRHIH